MSSIGPDPSVLTGYCEKTGIHLTARQTEQFMIYYRHLAEINQVMNLTAITDFEDVALKHFADSLLLTRVFDLSQIHTLLDLGTGAGFPGIPLKIVFPHLQIVLMDSLKKRVHFLNEVISLLELDEISAVHARAEEAGHLPAYREQFDLCVSRAVAHLSSLSEYCLPFVKKEGYFISYKSRDVEQECRDAGRAMHLLGGSKATIKYAALPAEEEILRSFVIIRKERNTAAKYPRKAGTPSREPL